MPSPEQGYVLIVRVWFHDGVPVARLLTHPAGQPPVDDEPEPVVAGSDGIVAAVTTWLTNLDPATPPPA
jgi:hypothetical protein